MEQRSARLKILPSKFSTASGVKGDIEKVFNKCRAKAEINGYTIFAIRVRMKKSPLFGNSGLIIVIL